MADGPDITAAEDRDQRRRRRRRATDSESARASDDRPPAEPHSRIPQRVRVTCPECGARFRAAVAVARRTTVCMACSADVPVPGRDELARGPDERLSTGRDRRRGADGPDDDARSDAPAVRRRRRKQIDPWPAFFVGVFGFPWREGVFSRWLLLSFGCSIVGIASVMMLYVAAMGIYSAVWALRMAWGWSCILTFGYASACCLPIITETAAGGDRVEGWPEPYWKDWALDLARVGLTALEAAAVAFGIAKLAELGTGHFWLPFLAAVYVLFPIAMLSSMHADSVLVPLTPGVLRSLVKCWSAWLMFYGVVALVSVAWPGLLVLGFGFNEWLIPIATAPLMSAVILIYARLLGRLGWVITQTRPRG
ncbi:MAG TPA: hypothetical protein VML55_01595 [Planctomycetaceae bacterium]|nr:hypothetical protein [Planctomycetaceae bacterium]